MDPSIKLTRALARRSMRPCRRDASLTWPGRARCFHDTRPALVQPRRPKSRDRGPKSSEDTQTDFGALDMLRNTVAPATSIDACTADGFALNNQMRISGTGVLLVGGEAYRWRPWHGAATGALLNAKRQWEVPEGAWGILELVYPKPDLLIIGTGPHTTPIAPAVRKYLNDLGIRLEIQDTRNAAAQFNLLATERGVGQVAAALIPVGWRQGR
ncbi:hypothetical protein ACJQWK_08587 [Exserohilum turcicum]|uniref:NADH dehydrogenase [ubiquinone] 1 alpha subcomplex assembly factor 3 n=1 Tax=Exserohilum turcicum (strain 28A) TaxID=671987 RepID=R0KAP2_EXST2|nr:uncharacterized protein SETTUDRAFT_162770 [Exserohilum turcica Et28A]EOA86494.1 hypothetical protein SETTUDRAFT_162770 [Exserohilum turcica Et28A]